MTQLDLGLREAPAEVLILTRAPADRYTVPTWMSVICGIKSDLPLPSMGFTSKEIRLAPFWGPPHIISRNASIWKYFRPERSLEESP